MQAPDIELETKLKAKRQARHVQQATETVTKHDYLGHTQAQ